MVKKKGGTVKGRLFESGMISDLAASRLLGTTHGAETLLEFVDPTFGINELFLSSEEGVGVCGETHGDDEVLDAVNFLSLVRFCGGSRDVAVSRGHVLEDHGVVIRMDVFFHGMPLKVWGATFPTPRGRVVVVISPRCQQDSCVLRPGQ